MADNLRFFAGAARCMEGRASGEYMAGHTSMIRREPVGVVGQIAPWNYPLMMAVWKIGPALATGYTNVLKPAEPTPVTTVRLAELPRRSCPPGAQRRSPATASPRRADRRPSRTSTGLAHRRRRDGQDDRRMAAETLKRVHLELGGKAPVLVFDDADPARARDDRRRLLELRPGLYGRLARGRRAEVYDDCSRTSPAVESSRSATRWRADTTLGPVISRSPAGPRPRLPRPGRARHGADRRQRAAGARLLRLADRGHRAAAARRDRPARGLRAGRDGAAVRRRRRGDRLGKRRPTGSRPRSGRATSAARSVLRGRSSSGRSGSTTTSRSSREMPHGGYKQSGYGKDLSMYSLEDYTRQARDGEPRVPEPCATSIGRRSRPAPPGARRATRRCTVRASRCAPSTRPARRPRSSRRRATPRPGPTWPTGRSRAPASSRRCSPAPAPSRAASRSRSCCDGRALGTASYLRIVPEHRVIEIGHIVLGSSLARTPAATEAIYLLARHAFEELGYRRLEWKCDALNAALRRAARALRVSLRRRLPRAHDHQGPQPRHGVVRDPRAGMAGAARRLRGVARARPTSMRTAGSGARSAR